MTLRDCFFDERIDLIACLPAEAVPVRLARLLDGVPWAKTVVFAAIPYYTGDVDGASLARFARVRDYHAYAAHLAEVLKACLAARHPAAHAAHFADHSPFDEVAGAVLAGLGVRGDNGLLITEKYSSYVFLFTLVTDLTLAEIEAEGIARGTVTAKECTHCGACRAACPGGCIGVGRETCASAISQKKGELSETEAAILRRAPYAWGCDACQDACPYTTAAAERDTLETEIPYFRARVLGRLTPEDIVQMPEDEYGSYAFGWRKKDVLIRNLTLREEDK